MQWVEALVRLVWLKRLVLYSVFFILLFFSENFKIGIYHTNTTIAKNIVVCSWENMSKNVYKRG